MKETAIDWLVERINHAKIEGILTTQRLYELKKIAKDLEKAQLKTASEDWHFNGISDKIFDDYYNENFC